MKHTKQEVFQNGNNAIHTKDGLCVATTYDVNRKENAVFITEAFNVTNETGYTPRQLADQKAELLDALKEFLAFPKDTLESWIEQKKPVTITVGSIDFKNAIQAIQNATK